MKVLLFCCRGFETMEFAPFVDVMGWARNDYGMSAEVVTAGFSKTVVSAFGIPVLVDKIYDEIDVSEYDALAIPGGFEEFGFYEDAYDERFLNLIREFNCSHKYIASVCVGALPVGASGILKGRKATTYHLGAGKRQKQLAELCEISTNALCSIETGQSFPSKTTISKICASLNIPESYLLLFSISEDDIPEDKKIYFRNFGEPLKKILISD